MNRIATFKPILKPKIWAENWINNLYNLNLPDNIGEIINLSNQTKLTNTSISADIIVENLPVMSKFIQTGQSLSIQTHRYKNEGWLVIGARKDAHVLIGKKDDISSQQWFDNIRIDPYSVMKKIDLTVGDYISCPAKTPHCLSGGLVVLEVQDNIDETIRIWDWGRDRELHDITNCIKFDNKINIIKESDANGLTYLYKSNNYTWSNLVFWNNIARHNNNHCFYTCLQGDVEILYWNTDNSYQIKLKAPHSAFIPSGYPGRNLKSKGECWLSEVIIPSRYAYNEYTSA